MRTMEKLFTSLALLLAAGCGGSNADAKEPRDSQTPSASAEPNPAESDECRSTMGQADAIATELETATIEDGTAFGQFESRLIALYKQAATDCSPRVTGDFAAAMDSMARVSARYTACTFMDPMFQCDVGGDLVRGAGLIHDATTSANATSPTG